MRIATFAVVALVLAATPGCATAPQVQSAKRCRQPVRILIMHSLSPTARVSINGAQVFSGEVGVHQSPHGISASFRLCVRGEVNVEAATSTAQVAERITVSSDTRYIVVDVGRWPSIRALDEYYSE